MTESQNLTCLVIAETGDASTHLPVSTFQHRLRGVAGARKVFLEGLLTILLTRAFFVGLESSGSAVVFLNLYKSVSLSVRQRVTR